MSVFLQPAEFQNGHTLDLDGTILACSHGRRRVERLGLDGAVTPIVERYRGRRLNSPNDVVVKSDGTIWFTDPTYGIRSDDEGHAADSEIGDSLVFRWDPRTAELDAVTDWLEEPNGLAFSPDESILYVSDTSAAFRTDGAGNRHIVAFDVVDGAALANPRVFYAPDVGLADGFRVDVDGNVWTSARDGIHVVAPDGTPPRQGADPGADRELRVRRPGRGSPVHHGLVVALRARRGHPRRRPPGAAALAKGQAGSRTARRRCTAPETPFRSTGPISRNATPGSRDPSATSRLTSTSPGRA